MMASPGAPFLIEWLERYKHFNQTCWNCNSVWLPNMLEKMFPERDIFVIPERDAFFSPGWTQGDLDAVYKRSDHDFSGNYMYHMWHTAASRQFRMPEGPEFFLSEGNPSASGFTT